MAFQMQIMGNRKNAYARLTKAKKAKVAKQGEPLQQLEP